MPTPVAYQQGCGQSALLRKVNENIGGGQFFKSPIYTYLKNHNTSLGVVSKSIPPR